MTARFQTRNLGGSLALGVPLSNVQAISASSATLSPASGSWTYAWWGRYQDFTSGQTHGIAGYSATYSVDGWAINQFGRNLDIYVKSSSPVINYVAPNGDVWTNAWARYVAVFDSSTHTVFFYKNGVLITQSSSAAWSGALNANSTISICSIQGVTSASPGGAMADACYDVGTAWTLLQVQNDYFNNQQPSTITHRWALNDGNNQATAIASKGGLNLTLTSATFSADSPAKGRGITQNLVAYGGDLTQTTYWAAPTNLTSIGVYGGSFPQGLPASVLLDNSTTSVHGLSQNVLTMVAGKTYLISAYAKVVAGNTWIEVGPNNANIGVWFNLSGTGTVGGVGIGANTAGIISDTNGGYRIWFTYTQPTGSTALAFLMAPSNGSNSYSGGTNQLAIGGVMVEELKPGQATPSAYIPTTNLPLSVYGQRDYRQNYILWSEDVTNAVWNVTSATATNATTDTTAPDGTSTAFKLLEANATALHRFYNIIGVTFPTPGINVTYSIYAKKGIRNWMFTTINDSAGTRAWFDLNAGTIGTVDAGASATIRPLANGWYYCTITCACPASCSVSYGLTSGNGVSSGVGDGTGTMYFWHPQFALGPQPSVSSYVKTTSSAVNPSGGIRAVATTRGTATNQYVQSNNMNASWSQVNFTGTIGQADPFGGTNATLWTESTDGSAQQHYTNQSITAVNVGEIAIESCYVKASTRTFIILGPDGGGEQVAFNLSTLATTVLNGSPISYGITAVTGAAGWYRVWILFRQISLSATRFWAGSTAAVTYQGNGSAAIYTYGAQREVALADQTTPSPYIVCGATAGQTGPRYHRQNLFANPTLLTSAPFAQVRSSLVSDATDFPVGFGFTTSFKFEEDASLNTHELRGNSGFSEPPAPYTLTASAFFKAGTNNWIALFGNAGGASAYFNLSTGVKGSLNGAKAISSAIVSYGNGWYRCSLTYTSDGTYFAAVLSTADGTVSYQGVNGTIASHIQGMQLNYGAYATDFVDGGASPFNPGTPRNPSI